MNCRILEALERNRRRDETPSQSPTLSHLRQLEDDGEEAVADNDIENEYVESSSTLKDHNIALPSAMKLRTRTVKTPEITSSTTKTKPSSKRIKQTRLFNDGRKKKPPRPLLFHERVRTHIAKMAQDSPPLSQYRNSLPMREIRLYSNIPYSTIHLNHKKRALEEKGKAYAFKRFMEDYYDLPEDSKIFYDWSIDKGIKVLARTNIPKGTHIQELRTCMVEHVSFDSTALREGGKYARSIIHSHDTDFLMLGNTAFLNQACPIHSNVCNDLSKHTGLHIFQAIFAIEDIEAGTELTLSYHNDQDIESCHSTYSHHNSSLPCQTDFPTKKLDEIHKMCSRIAFQSHSYRGHVDTLIQTPEELIADIDKAVHTEYGTEDEDEDDDSYEEPPAKKRRKKTTIAVRL